MYCHIQPVGSQDVPAKSHDVTSHDPLNYVTFSDCPANVEYKEADIAVDDVPLEQLSFLPYAFFTPRQEGRYMCNLCIVEYIRRS